MTITENLEIELTTEEIEELIRDLPRILSELTDDGTEFV